MTREATWAAENNADAEVAKKNAFGFPPVTARWERMKKNELPAVSRSTALHYRKRRRGRRRSAPANMPVLCRAGAGPALHRRASQATFAHARSKSPCLAQY